MAQVINFAAAARARGALVFPVLVLPKRSKKTQRTSARRDAVRAAAKARL